jgi:outer membrane usher protein
VIALAFLPGRSEAQPVPDQSTPSGPTTYLLSVSVNGWPLELIARFVEDGSGLRVPASEFDGLGFVVDEAFVTVIGDARWIYLDEVPGLAWTIDQREQAIDFAAPFDRLKVNLLEVSPPQPRVEARADWGAMLAWDAYGQWAFRDDDPLFARQLATTLDMRVFAPWAVIGSTAAIIVGEDIEPRATRLETVADFDNPEQSWRVRLGDSYTGGPVWVRPVRFGGAHWTRDFGLRPDIITTPVAAIGQDVAVPSTIDVFVNGVQRYSRAVGRAGCCSTTCR